MRKPIIAGNWKLNGTPDSATSLVRSVAEASARADVDVLVCPPFTLIGPVREALNVGPIQIGGQDCFWKASGAYTGQISAQMLREAGCAWVLVGHSERRGRFGVPEEGWGDAEYAYFADSDSTVQRKLRAALAAGLRVICCVGETLGERQQGRTDAVVDGQVRAALQDAAAGDIESLVFAYEPVWAIGTGEVCAAAEANRVCGVVRSAVGEVLGSPASDSVRVQYGGSVKADNAVELLGMENIDGALVGGASLKAADFAAIVAAAP